MLIFSILVLNLKAISQQQSTKKTALHCGQCFLRLVDQRSAVVRSHMWRSLPKGKLTPTTESLACPAVRQASWPKWPLCTWSRSWVWVNVYAWCSTSKSQTTVQQPIPRGRAVLLFSHMVHWDNPHAPVGTPRTNVNQLLPICFKEEIHWRRPGNALSSGNSSHFPRLTHTLSLSLCLSLSLSLSLSLFLTACPAVSSAYCETM